MPGWARAAYSAVSRSSGGAVGLLDGAQAGGDAGFAGGDSLAVAAAVGAFGQVLGVPLDFAEVGFAFVGVPGDREQGDVGGGGIQDEADGLAFGVVAGHGDDRGAVDLRPGLARERPCPSHIRWRRSASMRSARSIWWQAAPKFSPTGPRRGPRLTA